MSYTAAPVLLAAAQKMNDPAQAVWTAAVLLPSLAEAYEELQTELEIKNIPIVKKDSSAISVEEGDTELDEYPADYVEPISLLERPLGSSDLYTPMTEVRELPQRAVANFLIQWLNEENKIKFVGASQDQQVFMYYYRKMTPITTTAIVIEVEGAKNFLACRTAQIAYTDLANSPDKARELDRQTARYLDRLLRKLVKNTQGLGVRRRGYRGVVSRQGTS